MRFEGKVAVVTGAGAGMGRAMALMFAAEGARLVLADISGKEEYVAAEIGAHAVPVRVDVNNEQDIERMIVAAEREFGKLDVLCNNAGYGGDLAPLHEYTTESLDRIISLNLRGVFFGMKYGVISMLKTGGGAIVNTSSASGIVGWKHHSIYGAAKAGVNQLTKAAALDYADHNIRVNAVAPGPTWSSIIPISAEHDVPPPGTERVAGVPLDCWGLPNDIAAAALFLASEEAKFITGTILPVDGGYSIGFSGMGAEKPGM